MAESTASSNDVRAALEATDQQLGLLVTYLKDSSGDEALEREMRRSRKRLQANRELLGPGHGAEDEPG
jgi:hypothetical protein